MSKPSRRQLTVNEAFALAAKADNAHFVLTRKVAVAEHGLKLVISKEEANGKDMFRLTFDPSRMVYIGDKSAKTRHLRKMRREAARARTMVLKAYRRAEAARDAALLDAHLAK